MRTGLFALAFVAGAVSAGFAFVAGAVSPAFAQTVLAPPEHARSSDGAEPTGEGAAAPVALFPHDALGRAVGWELGPEPAPSSDEERAEQDLERWMDEQIAQDRVAAGIVDEWYYQCRRAMRAAFRPDVRAVLRDVQRGMSLPERIVHELARYAAPRQRPIDPGGVSPQTLFARSRQDEQAQEAFDHASPLHAPITWYRVELRVVHTRGGEVARVEVTRSSGSASLDRAALEAVRTGSVAAPRLPERLVGDRDAVLSEWAFEMGDVASRVDTVAQLDGPTGEGSQAGVLGRGLVRTSVSLLRVVDAEHPSTEERHAERRRAGRARRPGAP